MNAIW